MNDRVKEAVDEFIKLETSFLIIYSNEVALAYAAFGIPDKIYAALSEWLKNKRECNPGMNILYLPDIDSMIDRFKIESSFLEDNCMYEKEYEQWLEKHDVNVDGFRDNDAKSRFLWKRQAGHWKNFRKAALKMFKTKR